MRLKKISNQVKSIDFIYPLLAVIVIGLFGSYIVKLNNKLNDVIGNLKSLGTTNNIDGLHLEIVKLQKQINELKK